MEENLPQFRALDLWENPEYSGQLNAEQTFDLVLAATDDKAQAQRAGSQRAKARSDAGLMP